MTLAPHRRTWTILALRAALGPLIVAPSSACALDSGPPLSARSGSAIVRWSIDGGFEPDSCARSAADRFRITVFDARGAFVGEWIAPCRDFSTRVDLAPGQYRADAALVGAAGVRTTVVAIAPFTVSPNRDVAIEVDFPAASFS